MMRGAGVALVAVLALGACGGTADAQLEDPSTTSPLRDAADDEVRPRAPSETTSPPQATADEPDTSAARGESAPTDEPEAPPQDANELPLEGKAIAIDPGHNGGNFDAPEQIGRTVDAGGGLTKACNTTGTATSWGYRESTFNLELSLLLRDLLEAQGAEVHLTRSDDEGVGPCIDERGAFGGEVGADLLLSIHADGGPTSGEGFHLIRPSGRAGTDQSIVEPSHRLAVTLRDVLVDHGYTPATYLGDEGLVARDDLGTLNLSTVPAVLLEAGNLRNDDEARRLSEAEEQRQLAEALVIGLADHLGEEVP